MKISLNHGRKYAMTSYIKAAQVEVLIYLPYTIISYNDLLRP